VADAEARAVAGAFGDAAISVDHVGSTSVSGLPAKAVLDLLVGVREPRLDAATAGAMRRLGYARLRSRRSGRVHFRRDGDPGVFVHVEAWGSARWRRHLRFRDRLRSDAGLASAYAELKRTLAAATAGDAARYAAGKRAFVEAAVSREMIDRVAGRSSSSTSPRESNPTRTEDLISRPNVVDAEPKLPIDHALLAATTRMVTR